MSSHFITAIRDGILLNLRVSPGAGRSSIEGSYGECALKLKVAAPPVGGKANAEAERFLAGVWGASSRDKVILIHGVGPSETRMLHSAHLR